MHINDLQILIQLHVQAHGNHSPSAEQYPHAQEAHFFCLLPCDISTCCKMYADIGMYADAALLTQLSSQRRMHLKIPQE